ncbi:MAG: SH3 domain-containing protein [Clostridiales bacterium]|nr:SH3 domain-containing protein [Clostridiales bacterium]
MILLRKLKKTAAFAFAAAVLLGACLIPKAAAADMASAAGLVTTSSGALNVRSEASVTSSVLTKLPTGTYLTLISKTGSWWRVEYAPNRYGYASADYIQYVAGAYASVVSTSSGNLNVRSGPGTSYGIIGSLPNGRTAVALSGGGSWYRILYNGTMTGYVSAQFMKSSMLWPVPASYKINQYFGTHKGIDIGASVRGVPGDTIIAAQQGKVVYSGWLNGYGYVVFINSVFKGQLIQTRYGHLNSTPPVKAGDTVGTGQVLGYMGNSGTSTGVHLHFEVRIRNSAADCIANADSTPVNPLDYVK